MIIGVTGFPTRRLGNGKSAYSVYLALRAHLKYKLPLYANLHLFDTNYTFLESVDDLFLIEGGIVLLDDIQRAFMLGSRNAIKKICQLWSGASRKDDEYIIYSSSRLIDNVDNNLRTHTDIYSKPMFDKEKHTIVISHYDNAEQQIYTSLPTYLSKEQTEHIFTRYDTKEKVAIWRL